MSQEPLRSGRLGGHELLVASALVLALTAITACESGAPSTAGGQTQASIPASSVEVIPDRNDAQLALLKPYEKETGVAPRMMDFIGFPENQENAVSLAESMAGALQAWHKAGVQPIVIMEPTFNDGNTPMDLYAFHNGDYNGALDTFFATLHELGVTDEEMGTWVPFPEPNTPGWDNGVTSPALFISNTTTVAEACKRYFPNTPISVMLDSQTFLPSPDPNWTNGTMDPDCTPAVPRFSAWTHRLFRIAGFFLG